MKRGDKLICKKFADYEQVPNIVFEVNLPYYVYIASDEEAYVISFGDVNDEINECGLWFQLKKHEENQPLYLWDYFYTEKEIRKLKLQKLNAIIPL